jgi:hypothetical protein
MSKLTAVMLLLLILIALAPAPLVHADIEPPCIAQPYFAFLPLAMDCAADELTHNVCHDEPTEIHDPY